MKQTHISRAGRKAQILYTLYSQSETDFYIGLSLWMLAKSIDMKYSSHLKAIADELVADFWLQAVGIQKQNGKYVTCYQLTVTAYELIDEVQKGKIIDWQSLKGWFE